MKWSGNKIVVDPPKKPKKITATRFATILGLNPWSTDFEQWCEITRTYQKPFEDTIYTIAGKTIEPKQIEYMRKAYLMNNLRTPTDVYGENFFKKTWGDFFHDTPIFGGMWDSLLVDSEGNPKAVLEFKTTKRAEDWSEDVPEYYALQASLYARLLGIDEVIMVASFLDMSDYDHPEQYQPSADNTITRCFRVSERYPNFDNMVATATKWWKDHVETGISPEYDEKKDSEILTVLRTNNPDMSGDIQDLIQQAEQLKYRLTTAKALIAEDEKQYKKLTDAIKEYAKEQFRDGDTKVSLCGASCEFVLSKTIGTEIDKKQLEQDGLLEKYSVEKETYRLTIGDIK